MTDFLTSDTFAVGMGLFFAIAVLLIAYGYWRGQ